MTQMTRRSPVSHVRVQSQRVHDAISRLGVARGDR